MTTERQHLFTITPAPAGCPFDVFVVLMRKLADTFEGCTIGNFDGGYAVYADQATIDRIIDDEEADDDEDDG